MYKIVTVLAAFVVVTLAAPIQPTKLELIKYGSAQLPTGKDFFNSFPNSPKNTKVAIPPDNGGNYGDNLWKDRTNSDSLLWREVIINPTQNNDAQWKWTGHFPGKTLTHIRFLNIGRERGYVESITSSGYEDAVAYVDMFATQNFRVMIEVYGK